MYFKHQKTIVKTEQEASAVVQFELGDPVLLSALIRMVNIFILKLCKYI